MFSSPSIIRSIFLGASVCVILLGGGCKRVVEKNSATTPSVAVVSSAVTSSTDDEEYSVKIFEEKKLHDSSSAYEFTALYPVLHESKIDNVITSYITSTLESIRRDALNDPPQAEPNRSWKHFLEINYEIAGNSNDLVSIIFYIEGYSGGAHPYHIVRSFLFDKTTGKELILGDLFLPNSNYLKKISEYSISELSANLFDQGAIRDGAGPRKENFNVFSLSKYGITFYFNEYQVAAYASGLQTVDMPLSELQGTLRAPYSQKISALNSPEPKEF